MNWKTIAGFIIILGTVIAMFTLPPEVTHSRRLGRSIGIFLCMGAGIWLLASGIRSWRKA